MSVQKTQVSLHLEKEKQKSPNKESGTSYSKPVGMSSPLKKFLSTLIGFHNVTRKEKYVKIVDV